MRFQDAAKDARAVVYAGIQADPLVGRVADALCDAPARVRLMARAAMNGESDDESTWRTIFPTLLGDAADPTTRASAEAVLRAALAVAAKGTSARDQYRGAVVEEVTARLLARRTASVKRERRVLFDGVPAEIHPYDVTVEEPLGPASPLWAMPQVLITPHTAGETRRYEDGVIDLLLDNLDRLWRGEAALRNPIV